MFSDNFIIRFREKISAILQYDEIILADIISCSNKTSKNISKRDDVKSDFEDSKVISFIINISEFLSQCHEVNLYVFTPYICFVTAIVFIIP